MNTNERYTELIDSYRKEKKFLRQYNEGLRVLLEPYGLSVMEADILFAIYRNPRCDNITKLCADIGKTKGVVSRACDHLCKENYLSSKSDDIDRRVIHFKITAAVRSLMLNLSRYMTAMDYVHRSEAQQDLFRGRIDKKKGLIYPICQKENESEAFPYLPFCSYETFLKEKCLPHLAADDRDAVAAAFSLGALQETLKGHRAFETAAMIQTGAESFRAVFSAENIPDSGDAALLRVVKA